MEPSRTVRPGKIHLEMAHHTRPYPQPRHLSRPSAGAVSKGWQSIGYQNIMGYRSDGQGDRGHCGHLSQRIDAHRAQDGRGRAHCRAGSPPLFRKHCAKWHPREPHEDGHTRAHRQAVGTLRGHGGAARRGRLPPVLLLWEAPHPAATAVLDVRNQRRGARNPAARAARLAPLQWADPQHRTALLPVH